MRCLICEELSLSHICSTCQDIFLRPSIYKRKIFNNIEVISFYKYSEIKDLLHTKHSDLGYYIYSLLAKQSFTNSANAFTFPHAVISIAINDTAKSGYSHTALLNKALKCKNIRPIHSKLRATNTLPYSGKSKEFRLLHPRNFILKDFEGKDIILVDDIITTGATLTQAIQTMQRADKEVLFCLTLADAGLK